jgi:hypothetical protein
MEIPFDLKFQGRTHKFLQMTYTDNFPIATRSSHHQEKQNTECLGGNMKLERWTLNLFISLKTNQPGSLNTRYNAIAMHNPNPYLHTHKAYNTYYPNRKRRAR